MSNENSFHIGCGCGDCEAQRKEANALRPPGGFLNCAAEPACIRPTGHAGPCMGSYSPARVVLEKPAKPSLSLLPWAALPEVAGVMQSGVAKHGAHGWREPGKHTAAEYVDKALRHLAAHLGGATLDAESGKRHLAHAAADLLIALELDPR